MRGIFQSTSLCLLFVCGIACARQASWEELVRQSDQLCGEGKFAEAETYLLSAVKMAEGFRPADIRLAKTQHRLGTVYRELGRLQEAEKWRQRSLSAWKECVGERDPSLVEPLVSLTSLYLESGLHGRAEWLLGSWLQNSTQMVDPADPQLVRLLHNFAALQHARRRHSTAETLYRRALKAAETAFGPQSQEMAHC